MKLVNIGVVWRCLRCGRRFTGEADKTIYWLPTRCACGGNVCGRRE